MTYGFGLVPGLELTEILLRTSGKFEFEFEPEETVDVLHEIEQRIKLTFDLLQQYQ